MALAAKGSPDVSFMFTADPRTRTYGDGGGLRQIVCATVCGIALLAFAAIPAARAESPVRIVALGDSLIAGLGLPQQDGFVPRLQAALAAKGIAVEIANAGVSGDTSTDGLARLDWSVPPGTEAVIIELGANDMLRGIKPQVTRDALDAILRRLTERHIAVLLCGMRAAPNLGIDYGSSFERIYPELATKYSALLYPFFLDGVAANLGLLQRDGLHPTAAGVDLMVARILPQVEQLAARARAQSPS
jgi:acyl-CoA thioesterase-1